MVRMIEGLIMLLFMKTGSQRPITDERLDKSSIKQNTLASILWTEARYVRS